MKNYFKEGREVDLHPQNLFRFSNQKNVKRPHFPHYLQKSNFLFFLCPSVKPDLLYYFRNYETTKVDNLMLYLISLKSKIIFSRFQIAENCTCPLLFFYSYGIIGIILLLRFKILTFTADFICFITL